MPGSAGTYVPRDAHQPMGHRPWCTYCDSDDHLVVGTITRLNQLQETLAVAFDCSRCGGSRVLATTAQFVAAIMARPTRARDALELGRLDGGYIHCGEAMAPADPAMRNAYLPLTTDPGPADLLGVYLQTRVLRCRCGFQMELPH
ncbi:hypothetical protein [Arthrobacter sp. NPDC058192]|uniref:hypothetical protein n=1 Tax=Arthrobacter sp. NPDC058192 TaxID=3346372 RepID=UPI0036E7734F